MTRRFRSPTRLSLFLIVLWHASAVGVGLGELTVHSRLGQPLEAEVVISGEVEAGNIEVDVADGNVYRDMGLTPVHGLTLQVGAVAVTGEGLRVAVSSVSPVEELVLDLVLVLRGPGVKAVKHYPLLLDPPAEIEPAQTAARPVAPVSSRPPAGGRQIAAGSGTQVAVHAGDHLYGIARRLLADRGGNVDAMADRLFELNPHAFLNGDRNRLLAGTTLQVPVVDDVQRQDRATAARLRRADESDQIRVRAPPTPDEIVDALQHWVDVTPEQLAAQRVEAQRDLAFARTEIETYRRQNDNLRERIGGLEERVDKLRRLIAMKAELRELKAAQARRLLGAQPGAGGIVRTQVHAPMAPAAQSPASVAAAASARQRIDIWPLLASGAAVTATAGLLALVLVRRRRTAVRGPRVDRQGPDWLPDEL